jgi:deoxyribodipyrimidine photo-lyase
MSIEPTRIQVLCDQQPADKGRYVLYWMQQSQRAAHNPALEQAVRLANERGQGVLVGFGLYERYPDANERAFAFLLEGLAETAESLAERGIKLVARRGRPDKVALDLAKDASLVVCDRGYLRHQREWRRSLARQAGRRVVQVEGDVVVPVNEASSKAEYAARTIRPKINRLVAQYLTELRPAAPQKSSLSLQVSGDLDLTRPDEVLEQLQIDRKIGRVQRFVGGTGHARRRLSHFVRHKLPGYADARNDPADPGTSCLSPYLHFGQISPVEIANKVLASSVAGESDKESYLEELIVRRELAVNFVQFEEHYDSYQALPAWARRTLAEHAGDERPDRYTAKELEHAATDDRYWNAAMNEMRYTGYMHNYMRMYWGKKILEWCNTPEYAYRTTLALNNRYFLDGRDPSSYTGVAWIFGLHDRAWSERPVFGKIRYMNAGGLERKFDIDAYVDWVDEQKTRK